MCAPCYLVKNKFSNTIYAASFLKNYNMDPHMKGKSWFPFAKTCF